MKYSVIVPYYNAEKWLGRCLESLTKQKGDMEFLLVDDKSEDASPLTAKNYALADERFVLLKNEREKGVSGARNTGIDHAQGDWVTFVDADDELLDNAWKIFGHMIALDASANMIQANHYRHYVETGKTQLRYTNDAGVYSMDNLPEQWCMVWNKLYRRDFIGGTRFVEGLQYGEDEIFNLDMFAKDDRIFHTKQTTATVRRNFDNKESLSRVKDKRELIAQARALEEFVLACKNPRARALACDVLSEHWQSPTYKTAFGSEKYVIMCGGNYDDWDTPRQMAKINGEPLVARTIRLLRKYGIKDISISSNDRRFEQFGLPVLKHDNEYTVHGYNDYDGYWCNCFYPTGEPTCYIFGDVFFSAKAIKTIVQTKTDDVELFGSAKPFDKRYIKEYVEPFALKVTDVEHLNRACDEVKKAECWRNPLVWELWDIIKGYPADKPHRNRKDYTIINDYTCDIDTKDDILRLEKELVLRA